MTSSTTKATSDTTTASPTPQPGSNTANATNATQARQPLPLPAPPAHDNGETTILDMSGGSSTVKLDHLGPLVVNQDGTMSRVSNWAEMTDIERQNTLRILGKRNKIRLEGLRQQADRGDGVGGEK